VLDEAHHTKANHPYKAIMERYHYLNNIQRARTKVLGLTATPAQGREMGEINESLDKLLSTLHVPDKNFICISDDNREIVEKIPKAEVIVEQVDVRVCEKDFRIFLSRFVSGILRQDLPDHFTSLGISEVNGAVRLPSSIALRSDDSCNGQFQQWQIDITRNIQSRGLQDFHKTDILEAVAAICLMEEAAEQSRDLGYEPALKFLLDKLKKKMGQLSDVIGQCQASSGSLFAKIHDGIKNSAYMKMLPRTVLVAGFASDPDCGHFPKFSKLVEILEGYKDKENFHGMVFIRTRAAVETICQTLQSSCLRVHMEFQSIVGQASRQNQTQSSLVPVEQSMSRAKQNAVLGWFRGAGKKVLCTTSVSEEGVDIPSCELVVRYTSAQCGTEYHQSMGRARKQGAVFACIVEKGSKDVEHLRRCIKEDKYSRETTMRRAARQHL